MNQFPVKVTFEVEDASPWGEGISNLDSRLRPALERQMEKERFDPALNRAEALLISDFGFSPLRIQVVFTLQAHSWREANQIALRLLKECATQVGKEVSEQGHAPNSYWLVSTQLIPG